MSFTNLELVSFMEDTEQISTELATAIRSGNTAEVTGNQALTNAFVDLINKVIMVRARGITTINRWREFYKERIPFGSGIEYVTIGRAKDKIDNRFSVNAEAGENYGAMAIKAKPEMTNKQRIRELSTTRYAVTVGSEWISYAVSNEFGISDVTAEFMKANDRSLEIDTDKEFYTFVKEGIETGGQSNSYARNGVSIVADFPSANTDPSEELVVSMLGGVHDLSNNLATENTDLYTDGITRNLPKEDQLLIIDTYIYSLMKRKTYSGAFNLADIKIPVENIIVKDLGFKKFFKSGSIASAPDIDVGSDSTDRTVNYAYCIIADRNHYMIHDKKYKTTVEYVASTDTTNVYLFVDRKFYETYGQPVSAAYVTMER